MAEAVAEKKIEIKKIILQIGPRGIELTLEEAQKLHASLDSLFGKDSRAMAQPLIVKETHIIRDTQYVPVPYSPQPIWYWNSPVISWGTTGGSIGFNGTSGFCTIVTS